ncbi:MAG: IS1182 family transposase [Reyranella sp.]|nr:MAG: IS1182 family transposase [Reyranella sp.]
MARFVVGDERSQSTLFPERLDDYLGEDNPVRAIDVFVDELDLGTLGFGGVEPAATGRPAYHPATLLKIYVYGYLNRVQSSRRLERECQRNIELVWLTGRLMPDFKTIADFRKDNGDAIRKMCREFVILCRRLELFSAASVAIDGSKFKAVNTRDRNFTQAKMERRLAQIDESIARYLAQLDSADRQGEAVPETKITRLNEKIAALRQEIGRLNQLNSQMMKTEDKQISLTDPDARSMTTSGRGSGMVGYNVQSAVDTSHHLIVAHEVTNVGSDRDQLSGMAERARAAIGSEVIEVVADRGYYKGEEIVACEQAGNTVYLPKPMTSGLYAKGRFGKQDFVYVAADDFYLCPAGEQLTYHYTNQQDGKELRRYWTTACETCALKSRCTTGKERRISRWEHEAVLEVVQARLDRSPEKMRLRRQTVEHPFGTIKSWMGSTHFLMKRLKNVRTEMALHVLAYNMKRVIRILGVGGLMEAIRA